MTYDHIADLARKGMIERHTLLRGPTTRQLWTVARHVAGIAHLLGRCHKCDAHVKPTSRSCEVCNAPFLIYRDRNNLGLDDSDPTHGEIDGLSSFLSDTTILDTKSIPIGKPIPQKTNPSKSDERIGSPEFRRLQRSLAQSKRSNKVLIISLVLTIIALLGTVMIILKK